MRKKISKFLGWNKAYVRLGLLLAGLLAMGFAFFLVYAAYAQNRGATTETEGGVQTATFSYSEGNIKVFAPADAATGDAFLAGTVSAEPSGKTDEERERNLATLQGRVIEVEKQRVKASDKVFKLGKITSTGSLAVRALDRNGKPEKEASMHLLAEQPPTPRNFEIPYVAQGGSPVTTTGPMDDTLKTSFTIGNAEASLLAKSPRQATFKTPTGLSGPQDCTLQEGIHTQAGRINVAKISLSAARTDLRRGETEDFTWMVEGLENLPDQAYPLALTFNNHTISVVDMTVDGKAGATIPMNVTTGQVQNGKAQGRGKVRAKSTGGFFISATLSGADMLARGFGANAPWAQAIPPVPLVGTQALLDVTSQKDPKKCKSISDPKGCQSYEDPPKCGSKDNPLNCGSQGNPGMCASRKDPKSCDSKGNPQECGSAAQPERCDSAHAPGNCRSTDVPKNCESDKTPKNCNSVNTPNNCDSKNRPSNCDSIKTPDNCDSKKTPKNCGSDSASKADPSKCNSGENPGKCASAAQPEACGSQQKPDNCNSAKNPTACGSEGKPKDCQSVKEPDKCGKDQHGSSEYPEQCASAGRPENCGTKGSPTDCASVSDPSRCNSGENPKECASAGRPENCGTKGNPKDCESVKEPKKCASDRNPEECASKLQPKNCPDSHKSAQQPKACEGQQSSKTPGGLWKPCG